jgi:uroporphyrinogen-III decarboxylase
MKEDEYDIFLRDPTDFTLRYYLPRVCGALEPLAEFPPIWASSGYSVSGAALDMFLRPEFQEVARRLVAAAEGQRRWRDAMAGFEDELAATGFPRLAMTAGVGGSPFDAVSDFYRGMRGSMLDMFRRPEKLLAVCEKVFEMRMAAAEGAPRPGPGLHLHFMPLHRGATSFMSKEQFERFYWPGLKKTILAAIDMGYTPMPFFEGHFGDRLEYLLELPKGKVLCHFEHTDMALAKKVLGGHLCIMGNVPSSLIQIGTTTEVEDYCKKLIEDCAEGGGYILTHGSALDEAKPQNVKAMVDSVKKYGWY